MLTPALAARYVATFDRVATATPPQGIHWCLCVPDAPTAALGLDGHPTPDQPVAPDAPQLRRMWAASEVAFHAPLVVGAAIERRSTVRDRFDKTGASGALTFVTVEHETFADGKLAVAETQTLVYRAPSPLGAAAAAPPPTRAGQDWHWRREIAPDPRLLFRYSALTFNTHRIHYDVPYTTAVEGYPALVVHGPLLASLLLDLVDRVLGGDALARFGFRAVAPAYVDAPLILLMRREGGRLDLRVRGAGGHDHLTATATLR